MTNSNGSPRSSFFEIAAVAILMLAIVAAAGWYFYSSGYLLYYGDAQAHLNISRSWIDSRNAGFDQIGTVWLPVLHFLCLPFVAKDFLWESGLAGTIPVAACFVVAGVCFYLSGKEAFQNTEAALTALLCFALNPNVLYLATIPMTEIVFAAGLAVCLLAMLWFRKTQHRRWIGVAISASWWMSLTRYDGWFLLPFIAMFLAVAAQHQKLRIFLGTGVLAALAPLSWIANNWWETSNALDFYNGPYSAAAIQRYQTYEGFHDWPKAFHYYWEASRFCCGGGLLAVGILGLLATFWRGPRLAVWFLAVTPLFYVWSVHSSWLPIRVPTLAPFSYYNSRYALASVILMAFAAGALAAAFPKRLQVLGLAVPLIALLPWVFKPNRNQWICWKESEQNSLARRDWTAKAAKYLNERYHRGDGVLSEFGDLTAIFGYAHLPLKELLHEGSHAVWFANTMPNGLVHQTKWAIAQEGDKLAGRLAEGKAFHVVEIISVKGAPRLLIYERN